MNYPHFQSTLKEMLTFRSALKSFKDLVVNLQSSFGNTKTALKALYIAYMGDLKGSQSPSKCFGRLLQCFKGVQKWQLDFQITLNHDIWSKAQSKALKRQNQGCIYWETMFCVTCTLPREKNSSRDFREPLTPCRSSDTVFTQYNIAIQSHVVLYIVQRNK